MKIQTYKVDKYRNCQIYYRNFYYHFEYLTILRDKIYTAHITVLPTKLVRFLCWLGLSKKPYNERAQVAILSQLRKMAETTIDFILDKKDNKQRKR